MLRDGLQNRRQNISRGRTAESQRETETQKGEKSNFMSFVLINRSISNPGYVRENDANRCQRPNGGRTRREGCH